MKRMVIGMVLALSGLACFSQDAIVPEKVIQAFKTGNAKALAEFFNPTVELVILEKEDVYNRQQAEMILRDFFAVHPPGAYKTIHQGGKQQSQFAIGSLTTAKGSFRVYLLFKNIEGKPMIHQLRIEVQNE